MGVRIAIDRGGTFTDVCARDEHDNEIMFKLLSVDPGNYDDAPREGVRRVIEKITGQKIERGEKIDLSSVESIRMGTTVATNALLERKGERVAFIVTKGFKDILRIGQQARPNIFDLSVKKLSHLYESVYEVDERVTIEEYSEDPDPRPVKIDSSPDLVTGTSGEIIRIFQTPDEAEILKMLTEIWDSGVRSLAICLMHGYTYPQHEQLIAKNARKLGFTDVSVSSEIQAMIKLVSRGNSTTADAYLSPITSRYISNFGQGFKGGLTEVGHKLLFMQSDGGLTSWSRFSGLKAILSGPAGGVIGYAKTSYDSSAPVLGFDMGGTSTDVSRYDGHLEHIFETTTAEVTIQAPQLDINTVAAGGGSILFWKNNLFTVGPESASAHPGPACYRKEGPLTVTDANLFLGRIAVEHFPKIFGPNEDEPLDTEITKTKFEELTKKINSDRLQDDITAKELTPEQVAMGFLTVANEAMCRPIRTLTEAKGHESSKHALASFGGAGGQHACAVAENLGIKKVIIHKYSSVLSAFGMSLADVVVEVQQPESCTLTDKELERLNKRLDGLSEQAAEQLEQQGFTKDNIVLERYLNVRYRGTETFIMVEGPDFASRFVTQHRQEFGFSLQREILVGDVRVRGVGKSYLQKDLLPEYVKDTFKAETVPETINVYFDQGWKKSALYTIEQLKPGQEVHGPAMILDKTQTIVVQPNAVATSLPNHIVISVENTRAEVDSKMIDPIQLSVFGHRFMSIAEQMGQTLQKTSISTNIKERLDFSCAIFDPDGGLVANAPHIPVHLGSMSSAVAFQKQYWEEQGKEDPKQQLKPGDVLVANHPAYGGSHLPDITVITPVFSESETPEIIFWVASRGHHSDIGGITAGSMPPSSKELWEEGARIKAFKVVSDDKFDEKGLVYYLSEEPATHPGCSGSRSLSDSISDLKAQVAANNKGIRLISALIAEYGLDVVQLYMKGFQENAEQSVRLLFARVYEKFGAHLTAEDCIDDGTPIKLSVTISPENNWDATFDFSGTGAQVYGNLNAPRAICYSAILYVLRSIISDDIPLNQGCLKPLKIIIPEGTLLSPAPDAATVGGNVETSQRITDVVLRAFQVMGASQGTCNNLTFGFMDKDETTGQFKGFGYYETIAGGAGAGDGWNGQSGVQVHMTNTRSTDPEILEKRYPCILREFSLRAGSGGNGRYKGGDGVVRDIEFRRPIQVSILSERRAVAPFGICGGEDAEKGQSLWQKASGKVISLGGKNSVFMVAGDHVIIKSPGGGGYGSVGETKDDEGIKKKNLPAFVPRASGSFHARSAVSAAQ